MYNKNLFLIVALVTPFCNAMEKPMAAQMPPAAALTLKNILAKHTGPVNSVALSSDEKLALTGSNDGMARLWNISETPGSSETLAGHTKKVTHVAFRPTGQDAATGSDDASVRLWDISKCPAICKQVLRHNGRIVGIAFSRNGKYLLVGADCAESLLWDIQQSPATCLIIKQVGNVSCVAFSPKSNQFATGASALTRLWNLPNPITPHPRGFIHLGEPSSVLFSPDGKRILTVTPCAVLLWDPVTDINPKIIYCLSRAARRTVINMPPPGRSAAMSDDGKYLLITKVNRRVPNDNQALLYDITKEPKFVLALKGHTAEILVVAFCSGSCHALTGSADMTARLWDLKKSPPTCQVLTGHTGPITCIAPGSTGCHFLTGSQDGTARLWV